MASFAERLKSLRKEKGWSQQRLADELKISKSSVNMYERGEREPSFETMEAIADLFNADMDYLYGRADIKISDPIVPRPSIPSGFEPLPETVRLPRVGQIACGTPILAEANIDSYDDVPQIWRADFTLVCKGDSMEPKIKDGDVVAIRSQPEVEQGQIAAVRIGDEATLKRVFLFEDHIELRAENPTFASIVLMGEQMNSVHIEGLAVGLCRALQQ